MGFIGIEDDHMALGSHMDRSPIVEALPTLLDDTYGRTFMGVSREGVPDIARVEQLDVARSSVRQILADSPSSSG
jgi:hypothetical protein